MLRVRWLGRVPYHEAHALQSALHAGSHDDYVLLLEHPDVFTLGVRGDPSPRARRPGVGGGDDDPDRSRRRRHLPRSRPARRLSDRLRAHGAGGRPRPRPRRGAGGDRHPGRVRSAAGRQRRVPRCLGRPRRTGSPEDLCHRRPGQSRSFHARTGSERRSGHVLVRPDRALRTGRQGGDVVGRRGDRRPRWPMSSTSWPATARSRWAPDGVVDRQDVDTGPSARRSVAGRPPVGSARRGWTAPDPSPSGRRRSRRRAGPRRAQAPVAARPGPDGRRLPGAAPDDARPRPGDGVRGGGLSEHLRVLGRRDGHLHDQRRAVHPGLRVLPGRHPPSSPGGPRRTRAGGRGGGTARSRRTPSSPPSPATI